jgi:hypothetical protein
MQSAIDVGDLKSKQSQSKQARNGLIENFGLIPTSLGCSFVA